MACYVVGAAGVGAATALTWTVINLTKIRRALDQERESERAAAEEWRAETLQDLYQAVADQQARGILDFYPEKTQRHLRAVRPLKDDENGRTG